MKYTRRKRRGGKSLGEGERGFVIDPAIPCEGKNTSGYVSKVFKKKEDFENAKKSLEPIVAKLETIDPEQKEFLYPVFCETIGELTDQNTKDGVTEDNKYWSHLMKRGGETIADYIKRGNTAVECSQLTDIMCQLSKLQNQDVDKLPIDDIIKTGTKTLKPIVEKVFTLVDKLYKNGIVHRDLHARNVLRVSDGTLQIIDFDRARDYFKESDYKYDINEDKENFIGDVAYTIVTKGERTENKDLDYLRDKAAKGIMKNLMRDYHLGSRTGGVVRRSSKRTPYRLRRGKGNSRR
jgi:serine/threonine protein kinase